MEKEIDITPVNIYDELAADATEAAAVITLGDSIQNDNNQ